GPPVARRRLLVREQADVDRPPDPADVDLGQVGAVVHQLDDLTRDAQTHQLPPSPTLGDAAGWPITWLTRRQPGQPVTYPWRCNLSSSTRGGCCPCCSASRSHSGVRVSCREPVGLPPPGPALRVALSA